MPKTSTNSETGPSLPAGARKLTRSPSAPSSDADNAGIHVLCVDDHAVLIEGLKAQFAIEGRIRIVGHLPSAQGVLEEVSRLKPDVVLLDIDMPGPDVFETADRLRHMHPGVRFMFLSAHIRDGYLAAAYKCGAWGYFAKGDDLDDIVAGVTEIATSHTATFVMGPKVRERCAPARPASGRPTAEEEPRPATVLEGLTAREIEVLRLIGKGRSRTQIAQELCRSAKTVDGHQDRMMKKLGITSRADLMRFAIREGLAEA